MVATARMKFASAAIRSLYIVLFLNTEPTCIPLSGHFLDFGSLVILDVARCYLWLFTLYINIKISKNSC